MRFIDALLAFPGLILAIALVAALGPGLRNAMIAIGIVAIPAYARLVRGQVLLLKQMDFVTATRSLGARPLRLVFGHILPNLLNPIIVQISLSAGFAILAEATLSFLGLGAQVPTPDWGQMINSGRTFLNTIRGWRSCLAPPSRWPSSASTGWAIRCEMRWTQGFGPDSLLPARRVSLTAARAGRRRQQAGVGIQADRA